MGEGKSENHIDTEGIKGERLVMIYDNAVLPSEETLNILSYKSSFKKV